MVGAALHGRAAPAGSGDTMDEAVYKDSLEYFSSVREMDEMTPIERAAALERGDEVDRMPVLMMADLVLPTLVGMTLRESELSPKRKAELQIAGYRLFGFDGIGFLHGLYSLPMAMGGAYKDEEHLTRTLLEPPVKDIHDLSGCDLDKITLDNDDAARYAFDAIRYVQDEVGDEIPCGMSFTSPFTVATGVVGVKPLLVACVREPEVARQVLDFVLEAQWKLAEVFLKEGITVTTNDPVASCTLISPRTYRAFAQPYEREFGRRIQAYLGRPTSIHICGDTTKILSDVADAGFSTFSLDNLVDLGVAKNAVGDRLHLVGNVSPVAVMKDGTPEEVRSEVRLCYRKAWDTPSGFTIDNGCDLPYGTPRENMLAYLDEAKRCAADQARARRGESGSWRWDLSE